VHQDITNRKQVEEALKEMEVQYRNLFENANEAIFVAQDGWLVFLNPMSTMMIGYSGEELMAKSFTEFIHPDDREMVINRHSRRMKGEEIPFPYSFRIIHKDGNSKWVEVNPVLINWIGRPATLNFMSDITDRKRAEEALRKRDILFKKLSSWVPGMIYQFMKRPDGTYCTPFTTEAIKNIFGCSPQDVREDFSPIARVILPEDFDKVINSIEDSAKHLTTWTCEYRVQIPGQSIRWILGNSTPEKLADGGIIWHGFNTDITERKKAEEQLHASLREKEILLSEVHHRVKNNMQVISGLLDLQARSSGNPELTGMLNESQSRIHAMSLVHEKLYGSKNFARIDLAGYVRTILQDLFQSYKINPGKIDLIIQTDGDVYVDINKAIPSGLILNELISNALKHAFPGDRYGELQIIIRETKNAEIEIVVRDNGLGLPDDINIHQPRSVGLHLVNGLVKNQLDGQIEIRRDSGTEIRIKFPL